MRAHELLLLLLYYAALALLSAQGVHRASLLLRWKRRGEQPPAPPFDDSETRPFVTVQLPLFNERAVAERAIRAAAALEWPRDRFQLQVLDDSTDATREIVERVAASERALGTDVQVIRRSDRSGFKAGALANALPLAKGRFLALFDADFLPPPDFLERTLPEFRAPSLGMVQARWAHINRDANLFHRAQAALLDGHFVAEQTARSRSSCFFNFNGTAGVWRLDAIRDAGGWEADTLTEDLDLSYRSQLAGWRFLYRTDVEAPAELPNDVASFRSQQHRWAKGGVETLFKLAPRLLASALPGPIRAEAWLHLTANLTYPLLVFVAAAMPILASLRRAAPANIGLWLDLPLAVVGAGSLIPFYAACARRTGATRHGALLLALSALALDIGISLHKGRAVAEAILGIRTGFVRTPKSGSTALTLRRSPYATPRLGAGLGESAIAAWSLFGLLDSAAGPWPAWGSIPFLALFAVGFGWVGLASLAAPIATLRPAVAPLREQQV